MSVARQGFLKITQRPSNALGASRSCPSVLALMEAGCRVCTSVWRGGVIQFPWLIFCFFSTGVLKIFEEQGDHRRRKQDETQEGAWSPNIWQSKTSTTRLTSGQKKRSSDLWGSKCALGAWATVASLSVFKWASLKEVGATSRPWNANEAGEGAAVNTWKSVPFSHKVDKVSVKPKEGFSFVKTTHRE